MKTFHDTFHAMLRRAVAASAVAAPLLAGCGAPTVGFQAPACEQGQLSLDGISPATPVAYAELRTTFTHDTSPPRVVASLGTKCGDAPDAGACQAAFQALPDGGAFYEACFQICQQHSLATTAGATVRLIDTVEAWKDFLGPLDTAQEAALWAWSKGYSVQCGSNLSRGAVRQTATGFEVIGTKGFACGPNTAVTQYVVAVSPDGGTKELAKTVLEVGAPNCAIGRRPDGLHACEATASSDVGAFLSAVAHLEAASVPAFTRLVTELRALNAPQHLQDAALRGAAEEVIHAGLMSAAAQRYGATPPTPLVDARPLRGALALALDNATQGCVRETFGAAVALHQAQHAADDSLQPAFARIAEDEANHAAFSWALHAWLLQRLTAAERAQVEAALTREVDALAQEAQADVAEDVQRLAGMPGPQRAQALVAALRADVWA